MLIEVLLGVGRQWLLTCDGGAGAAADGRRRVFVTNLLRYLAVMSVKMNQSKGTTKSVFKLVVVLLFMKTTLGT